jgi:MFS family permease
MTNAAAMPLRQNRNWVWLWRGQSISVIGDMVFIVTVILWIATRLAKSTDGATASWAPAAVSGALIAFALPALVVGPFAGVWVDRWDRRKTMLTADAARCILIAGLLVLPVLQHRIPIQAQLAVMYAVLVAASSFAEFFDPARMAIIGSVVAPDDQPKASGREQAMMALAQVIGPPLAAVLILSGVQWALLIDAASFAASFFCVRAIKLSGSAARRGQQSERGTSFGAELRFGLSFFMRSKQLRGLAMGVVITMLGAGAFNAVAVFFLLHNLHVPANWLGALSATVGVGAIGGALTGGAIAGRVGLGRTLWLSMAVGGVALIGLSRCTAVPPALATCLILGAAVGAVNAVAGPITLRVTPLELMGRISAVFSPLQQSSALVSMALAGALASTVLAGFHARVAGLAFGPYDSIIAVSGLLFIAAAVADIKAMRHLPPAPVSVAEPAAAPADVDAEPATY